MLSLKMLSLHDGIIIYQMLQGIAENDHGFLNPVQGMSFEEYEKWLKKEYDYDQGLLENWMVPQSSYWLYDDETPVGYGRIRHKLNDHLKEYSGHIGYAITKSERGRGYGKQLLGLLLEECNRLTINPVQIGADSDNIASNRIILNHGGKRIRVEHNKYFYLITL